MCAAPALLITTKYARDARNVYMIRSALFQKMPYIHHSYFRVPVVTAMCGDSKCHISVQ